MIFYFRYEKARLERQRIAEAAKGVGKPKVGGKFELVDHQGRKFGDEDLKGGFSLVSSRRCGIIDCVRASGEAELGRTGKEGMSLRLECSGKN